jgi:hypothetical protein
MVTRAPRLLIKSRSLPANASFALGKMSLRLQPLFPKPPKGAVAGMAAQPLWYISELSNDVEPSELWDLCHQLRSGASVGLAANGVEFAEPDFLQQWDFEPVSQGVGRALAAQSGTSCHAPVPPMPAPYSAPSPYDWRWFQASAYTGLDAARARIDMTGVGPIRNRVTIAHLDTGYRQGHSVLPQFLDLTLQHSYVKDDADPNSACDPDLGGFGRNPGHGTGTVSLLAGNTFNGAPFNGTSGYVGGAPFARVIPVRVANGVVEFANSSIAQGFQYAIDCNVDVLSMSMGGIPSQVWVEVVNSAYDAGITLVTAAGNNYGPGKLRIPRFIVYPARFRRVIAACGVMSNASPYADFSDQKIMGGSYGPDSKMDTAMAGYTPNVPWASYDCPTLVNFSGNGTSAATPQVAAAAACYIQKNLDAMRAYPKKWMRVESVRNALFQSADGKSREHVGRGILRANKALDVSPAAAAKLSVEPEDSISVPFLGPVFHSLFGVAGDPASEKMFHLEAAQILSRNGEMQQIFASAGVDPDASLNDIPVEISKRAIEAMLDSSGTSQALKKALGGKSAPSRTPATGVDPNRPGTGETPPIPAPLVRSLRVFAFDPALGLRLDTEALNETRLDVSWEADLKPGPVGEYIEVVDVDPATDACYAPVDLNHPYILAAGGLPPSEALPQFHQQMVYAVSMTTIGRFERALGRTALWSSHEPARRKGSPYKSYYVQRLRIYPHALREANAYYSPAKKALLFGYFQANLTNAGDNLPGGVIFNCLSHDVVAHETTHALLDGLHPYYQLQTNPDLAAFHEAFADIVALFQHFSIPDALRYTVAQTRGNLNLQNLLADLAQQFGQASDGSRALRSALGKKASPTDYADATEAHDRGAVLLAALFEAFLDLYEARSTDLKRLATGGTGVLPEGDISADLVMRLCVEAAETASRVLTACIRALDYCPPVDLTFGDFLRALITADLDMEPISGVNARVAFIAAFRARGIYPSGVRSLSEESLRWQPPSFTFAPGDLRNLLSNLSLNWNLATNRRRSYEASEENGKALWIWLKKMKREHAIALGKDLGVYLLKTDDMPSQIPIHNGFPALEIHSVRPARRIASNGQQATDLVVEMVQRYVETDPDTKEMTTYRGGCTLLIDLEHERVRYAIRKRVGNPDRIAAERTFTGSSADGNSPYFLSEDFSEPFAMLHRGF